jgi:hypothetical protein
MALSKDETRVPHPDLNILAAFIDGRLSEADRAGLTAHLGGCVDCRAILATHARGQMPAAVQGEQPAGQRSRSRFRPAVWLPIAATLALATTAGLVVWRIERGTATPPSAVALTAEPARPQPESPATTAPRGETPARPPQRRSTAAARQPPHAGLLSTRRGAARIVNGKTFRMVAGEWIDDAYDPVALLPVQDIVGSDARAALLDRTPALGPYAALGPKVTVTHEGVVYRFRQ